MKKFRIVFNYFDTGTKKDHEIEFKIDAKNDLEALDEGKKEFHKYESLSNASWVRIINYYKIIFVKED